MDNKDITDWNNIPKTDELARPILFRPVTNVLVIEVTEAFIRGAHLKNCVFELDEKNPYRTYSGKQKALVKCFWFGKKPKTTWMNLTLIGPYKELSGFTGKVVENIGR